MNIFDILIKMLEYSTAGGFALTAIWYKNRLDKKKAESSGDDLGDDYNRKMELKPILDEIRYQMNADRVHEWVASNGDTSLSGHHLKKLSIFMESHKDGLEDISQHFQLIPVQKFARHVDSLSESEDGVVVSQEFHEFDELGALSAKYDIKTKVLFKVVNELGKWTGILTVCFEDERLLDEGEIAFCKLQAARIGAIR